MKEGMEEPYVEGVATHDGPEPCAGAREGAGEALDRGTRRRDIEPRNQEIGVPTQFEYRKATSRATAARAARGPRAVGDPQHARNLHAREPGDPDLGRGPGQ